MFIPKRYTTSQILESEFIATQRRNTLEMLKKNSIDVVYKKLEKKFGKMLKENSVKREKFYGYIFSFSKSDELRLIAGNKLEEALNEGEEITKKMNKGENKRIFFIEAYAMKSALNNGIEEIEYKKNNKT